MSIRFYIQKMNKRIYIDLSLGFMDSELGFSARLQDSLRAGIHKILDRPTSHAYYRVSISWKWDGNLRHPLVFSRRR